MCVQRPNWRGLPPLVVLTGKEDGPGCGTGWGEDGTSKGGNKSGGQESGSDEDSRDSFTCCDGNYGSLEGHSRWNCMSKRQDREGFFAGVINERVYARTKVLQLCFPFGFVATDLLRSV